MKVFLAFLLACFVVGGLPATRRISIKQPLVLFVVCTVVTISFISLKVVL